MGQVAHIGTAVLLLNGDAEQPHVAKFAPHVHRELVVAVNLLGARSQLGLAELVDRIAQHVDLFAEIKV